MYECESWTIKKAEHRRIDASELWCWRRLLRVPWTERRSNLKDINPGYTLEGLMLKLQYFGHLMWRAESLEKTLMLGKIEGGRRRWEDEMVVWHPPTQWTWVWANSGSWWWTEKPGVLQSMGLQGVGHDWTVYLFYGQQFLFLNLILLICSSPTLPFSNHNFVFYVRRCSSDPNIGLGFGVLFAFLLKHMSLTRLWDIVT